MCILCSAHARKIDQFQRASTQLLDPLSIERIALALKGLQESPPNCRETWGIGQRVSRTNLEGQGTVVQDGACLKVDWDDGATGYYEAHKPANIRLEPER